MMTETSHLEICIYGIDGSARTFIQQDPELVDRTLLEFHPAHLFQQDRIVVVDQDSRASFLPPLVARVDLITARLSVWDFPFSIAAPVELAVWEFQQAHESIPALEHDGVAGASTVLLDLQTVDGRHTYLRLQTVPGFPKTRLSRIYALFKQRRLIFGLARRGIGVLNLANLLNFSVYPNLHCRVSSETEERQSPAASHASDIPDPWDGGKWNSHRKADESAELRADDASGLHATPTRNHAE